MKEKRVTLPEDMWEDVDKQVEEGQYSSRAEYVRTRIEAGESNIQALRPNQNKDDKSLSADLEEEIHAALSKDFQSAKTIQEKVAEEFTKKVSDWLIEAADDITSPVERSGLEFRVNNE